MNDQEAGRLLRTLRHRRGWRQVDLAARARLSQSTGSEAELGRLEHLTLGAIRRLFATCDASVGLDIRWRGGEVDRVLDELHAEIVRAIGEYLSRHRWTCWFEVTYSHFGERGSIDVLAVRGDAVLVVEVKSELTSVEATLRKLDEKARLVTQIVFERTGRRPRFVGRLLVLPDTTAARDRVARHAAILDSALPGRALALRAWLRAPAASFAGIHFVRNTGGSGATRRASCPKRRIRADPARPIASTGTADRTRT